MIHSIEAEMSALGCILLDNSLIDKYNPCLTETDFTTNAHRAIWRAIERNRSAGVTSDIVTVMDALEAAKELEKAGDLGYLADLPRQVPTTFNYKDYYDIVKDYSGRRQMIKALEQAYKDINDLTQNYTDMQQSVLSRMENLPAMQRQNEIISVQQAAQSAYDDLADRLNGHVQPLYTGLGGYDRMTGGLFPGELTVLAARPGKGKSALSWQIAEHISRGCKVLFVSREMPPEQLGQRALARATGISGEAMRNGKVSNDGLEQLSDAVHNLYNYRLDIDANSRTPRELRASMRGRGYRLLVCDYIQIMSPNESGNSREQEVASITRALKALAIEYRIPVLGLSQLNREPDKRQAESKTPRLSDLRESGAIEQDADNVVFIHEPDTQKLNGDASKWRKQCTERKTQYIELHIKKQRMGRTGWVPAEFNPKVMTFKCFSN